MRVRGPAYGVMNECLRIQASARRQSWIARVVGVNPLHRDARSWYRSAIGEIRVAKALKNLGPDWTVLQAVQVGSNTSEIDHVAIGPAGLFTISTKDHTGQRVWVGDESLLVNGHRTNHIANARYEAHSVERLLRTAWDLPLTVIPLIAVIDPGSLGFAKRSVKDVVVVRSSHLARTMTRRKQVLSDSAISVYTRLVDERSTWHTDEHVLDETLRHEQRFHRLQHEVAVAALRRHVWIMLAVLAVGVPLVLTLARAVFAWGA